MNHNISKKITSIVLSLTLIIYYLFPLSLVNQVWATPQAPGAPSAPQTPTSPNAPTAPTAPTSPTSPSNPQDPTPTSNPEPTAAPQNTPAPTQAAQPPATQTTPQPTSAPTTNPTPTTEPEDNQTAGTSNGSNQDGQTGQDTEIETGDASATGSIQNTGNQNATISDPGAGSVGLINEGNGADSNNNNSASTTNNSTTVQSNVADVNNSLEVTSETGANSASNNTGGNNQIETGDANVTGTIINSINTNVDGVAIAEFNIVDDHVGDYVLDFNAGCVYGCGSVGSAQAANSNNGAGSTNTNDLNYQTNDLTFQNNDATINNGMVLVADTGNNQTNANTNGDNSIETGDANINANVITFANNNVEGDVIYTTVNIYGDLVGDIYMPEEYLTAALTNSQNGAGSTNTNNYNSTISDATYQYNEADINNNIQIDANTGDNQTSANTGGASQVETGDTSVVAQVLNVANSNVSSDQPMWLVIVNELGNWVGYLFGAPQGQNYAGSDGTVFTVGENGQITASNNGNGADSQNTNNINQSSNSTTVQANTATVNNDIVIEGNTGNNSSSRNTGGTSQIETGDVNVVANLVNFVNNNIVGGGQLFVTTVNIFGSWVGNFFGPGQQPNHAAQNQQNADSEADSNQTAIGGYVSEDVVYATETVEEVDDENQAASTTQSRKRRVAYETNPQGQVAGVVNTAAPRSQNQTQSNSENPVSETLGNVVASARSVQPRKIRINLAWIVIASPIALIGYLIRRRFV